MITSKNLKILKLSLSTGGINYLPNDFVVAITLFWKLLLEVDEYRATAFKFISQVNKVSLCCQIILIVIFMYFWLPMLNFRINENQTLNLSNYCFEKYKVSLKSLFYQKLQFEF